MKVERIKQMLLVTIGMMAAIMGYYIWIYNIKGPDPKPEPIENVSDADVVVSDFEVFEMFHDRKLWALRAKVAEVYNARQETQLEDVEFDFFDEHGNKSMYLISDYGIKNDQTGNVTLSGNVQATAIHEGTTLKADEIFYDAATGKITSDKHVTIKKGNMITEGEGLESDSSLKKAKILRNIKTYFILEK